MIEYLVEANDFERQVLWERHSSHAVWEQRPMGLGVRIGWMNGAPMALQLSFARINGCDIAFYDPISLVVDYAVVNRWLQGQYPDVPTCNAQNFHQCLHHCIRHHDETTQQTQHIQLVRSPSLISAG